MTAHQVTYAVITNASHQLSLDQVALPQDSASPISIVMRTQEKFAPMANASHQLSSDQVERILFSQEFSLLSLDQVALLQDSASPISIVTRTQEKFVPMANVSHQLSSDQVALTLLDQVVFLPLLDQVALLQDFARPTVTVMKLKSAVLVSASHLLLLDQVAFNPSYQLLSDQVALLQDFARLIAIVMKMQVKSVMLVNAFCPLL